MQKSDVDAQKEKTSEMKNWPRHVAESTAERAAERPEMGTVRLHSLLKLKKPQKFLSILV